MEDSEDKEYGLYNAEFSIDVKNTSSFEAEIDEYFFEGDVDANIIKSEKVGRNLIVLFEREAYRGHYGIANLESGIFNKYRFISADLDDWPLYNCSFTRDKKHILLHGINDLEGVESYAIYPSDDTSKEAIYRGKAEQAPFLRVIKLEKAEKHMGVQCVHYYDKEGKEIDFRELWKQAAEPVEGRTSSVGSAELFLIYFYLIVILFLGLIFARYFLVLDD